jgi:carbonic anhydrase
VLWRHAPIAGAGPGVKLSSMNITINSLAINSLVLVGLSVCGTYALAEDSMSRATPTNHQAMRDCIEKQKMTDVNMSQAAMKRLCKDQLKQQKQTGAAADPAPTDTPRN